MPTISQTGTIHIQDLLYKMADDQLILGHRNSEWTGIGPLLEEDIAFASMAQDKVGHARALYQLLHNLGTSEPDVIAFMRNADQFHCSQLVELPVGEYDFSLIRHFLYDTAEILRFQLLKNSTYTPLAEVATKFYGELKYHMLHAKTFIKQLGNSTPEAINRMQASLDYAAPYALGMFEASPYEDQIIAEGIFAGEAALKALWLKNVETILATTQLHCPDFLAITPIYGGRVGQHTPHLQPLLEEMTEVFRVDPSADW